MNWGYAENFIMDETAGKSQEHSAVERYKEQKLKNRLVDGL